MSDPLDKLKKWQQVTDAATEGPWVAWVDMDGSTHMRGMLMVGNADAVIPGGESWVEGVDVNPVAHTYVPQDREFIATASTAMPALLTAVQAVLDLHRPFRVYDECECTDEQKDDGYHVEVNDIGLTCNHIYTVCGECCTDDEYVTEACSYHDHREGEPICRTVKAIRDALGGAA